MGKSYLCKTCGEDNVSKFYKSNLSKCKSCHLETSRRSSRLAKKQGLVYFIYAHEVDRIKIGHTYVSIEKRSHSIEGQSPCHVRVLGFHSGDILCERQIHKQFAKHNHHREWFNAHDDIWEYIRQNCETPEEV